MKIPKHIKNMQAAEQERSQIFEFGNKNLKLEIDKIAIRSKTGSTI